MSKCRQFQGLSTGMSTLTIPNHTIKLQLHRPRHPIIHIKKNQIKYFVCSAPYQGYVLKKSFFTKIHNKMEIRKNNHSLWRVTQDLSNDIKIITL